MSLIHIDEERSKRLKKIYDVLVPCEVSRFASRGIFSGGDDGGERAERSSITNRE